MRGVRGAVRDAVDGARMAVGTLTAVPVRVDRVDRAVAGWAMALAPAVGAGLGAAGAAVFAAALLLGAGGPLSAVLALGLLALLTRALHLDGLADLADGLGSGRPAEEALAVMKRSDIGPFGVVALVFAVLVQAAALVRLAETGLWPAAAGLVAAAAAGRLAITAACTPGVPPARPEGLGAFVAGSVPRPAAGAAAAGVLVLAALCGLVHSAGAALALPAAAALGVGAALALLVRARRRLGGITGDVLGALCETASAAALTAAAVLL
ncbi:adenosylcobinamide-GDP ribazoletransferase [Nocardiopsis composta]|uniref:Adenosylcobinamide-GDP ribazoletransferase n=3 Tax=Nocardiopsis composta TaxID=157465 RepID=A0A7W8VH46_9ACTN|nr:adenosylcobinamide-GDP ribazoletransferase [Nocardiopsis composta]